MTGAVVMRTSGGLIQRNPTENRLRALLGALSRGDYAILEQVGRSDSHYIQALLRPDGFFQLEYRAGQPSETIRLRQIRATRSFRRFPVGLKGQVHGVTILAGCRSAIGSIGNRAAEKRDFNPIRALTRPDCGLQQARASAVSCPQGVLPGGDMCPSGKRETRDRSDNLAFYLSDLRNFSWWHGDRPVGPRRILSNTAAISVSMWSILLCPSDRQARALPVGPAHRPKPEAASKGIGDGTVAIEQTRRSYAHMSC